MGLRAIRRLIVTMLEIDWMGPISVLKVNNVSYNWKSLQGLHILVNWVTNISSPERLDGPVVSISTYGTPNPAARKNFSQAVYICTERKR